MGLRKASGSIKPHEVHSSQGIKNSNSTTNKTTQKVGKKNTRCIFLVLFYFFLFFAKKKLKTRMIINACWVCHRTMSAAVPSAATATAPSPVLDSGFWMVGSGF